MEPVLQTSQIRQIEKQARNLDISPSLMEKAGMAIAAHANIMATDKTRQILILAGPGHNGGDAIFAALHLKQRWFNIRIILFENQKILSNELSQAREKWLQAGGKFEQNLPSNLRPDLIIDGLFGIGLNRNLKEDYNKFIKQINNLEANVLSIDIPSGLNADTGVVMGAAIKATETITFLAAKPGLFTNFGPDFSGKISINPLGIDEINVNHKHGWLLNCNQTISDSIPKRQINSHKGHFGTVRVFGGSQGMMGASILSGRAALRLGAGKVHIGILGKVCSPDWKQPDLMIDSAQNTVKTIKPTDILIVGPGLGNSSNALTILKLCIKSPAKLVLDADGLNMISNEKSLGKLVRNRQNLTVFTPHPAEAGRLLKQSTFSIQNDRIEAARTISQQFKVVCLLKGAGSIVSNTNGDWYINKSGNPGMATGGMGDVLSGIIGALLAQNASGINATLAACRLHGMAADRLTAKGIGPIGLTASETIDEARIIINELFLQ